MNAHIMLLLCFLAGAASAYQIVRDYSGEAFFDGWDFYGSWDNLTLGDVWWLNQADAQSLGLAYVNDAGHAIMKVDNTTNVLDGQKRNSVRITSQSTFSVGSLWIIDLLHLPYGCSVWPAFWTFGPNWPEDGEIDIIEGINLMDNNQMALHTTLGCTQAPPSPGSQTGTSGNGDCSQPSGCLVTETKPNSYQSGFAAAGGGVWAAQFDVAGVFIWFWSRANVPASVAYATSTSDIVDLTQWGPPSAAYPASTCDISTFFTPQNLVLDITLCGDWASLGQFYNATCGSSGPTGICYNDNVVGAGSPKYDNAYFEISYVRAYTTPVVSATATATSGSTATATGGSAVGSGVSSTNAARRLSAWPPLMLLWLGVMVGAGLIVDAAL